MSIHKTVRDWIQLVDHIAGLRATSFRAEQILERKEVHSHGNVGSLTPAATDVFLEFLIQGFLCPYGNAITRFSAIDNNAGDIVALVRSETLANNGKNGVNPVTVYYSVTRSGDHDAPLSTFLIERVFPFWFDAVFEEVVRLAGLQLRGLFEIVE